MWNLCVAASVARKEKLRSWSWATPTVPSRAAGLMTKGAGTPGSGGGTRRHFTGTAHTLESFSTFVACCLRSMRSKSTSVASKLTFGFAPMLQIWKRMGSGLSATVAMRVSLYVPSLTGKQHTLTSLVSSTSSSSSCGSTMKGKSSKAGPLGSSLPDFLPFDTSFAASSAAASSDGKEDSKAKVTFAGYGPLFVMRRDSTCFITFLSGGAMASPGSCPSRCCCCCCSCSFSCC
mmetsp:Transcript_129723/g.416140  ORF Transcript_129723/g.416140 Transcript_129723/m.416140 type:complete len:233 (-) Transcript_129723:556-1254(-)